MYSSFLAGALPLSMTLSQSQLRLLSSIGVGVLVGTSLIIIIPEGIEAAASAATAEPTHAHRLRRVARRSPWGYDPKMSSLGMVARDVPTMRIAEPKDSNVEVDENLVSSHIIVSPSVGRGDGEKRQEEGEIPGSEPTHEDDHDHDDDHKETHDDDDGHDHDEDHDDHIEFPSFEIGFSLILGFVLMFLIDRLPKHATESFQAPPQMQHVSLDNLMGRITGGSSASAAPAGGADTASVDEEAEGFLGSMAPSPRRARTLATTLGLVIHAAADGIAMGASSTTSDQKLGFIIFVAIMIHKAPAAFGLTSVLLKQGLSKRAARGHLIVFSLAAPVGALATWLLITILGGGNMDGDSGKYWTGMLLLFSGGTFL